MAKTPNTEPPSQPQEKEKLYTVDEVCKMLNVDRRTMVDWVQHHRIPYIRVDKEKVRFRMSDLALWLKKQNATKREKFVIK